LKTGDICSFQIYPTAYIGTPFKDVVFLDRVSYHSVPLFNIDPQAEHVRAYPTLPPGSSNDPTTYNWLSFKTQSGEVVLIADPWMKTETLVVNSKQGLVVRIEDTGDTTMQDIRLALLGIGLTSFTIESTK
jgi:hypothetical protein